MFADNEKIYTVTSVLQMNEYQIMDVRKLCFDQIIPKEKDIMQWLDLVIEIFIDDSWNQPLTRSMLPGYYRKITFGYLYNQPLSNDLFPDCLTEITFGYSFNQKISRDQLPCNLNSITFGDTFNQSLDGTFSSKDNLRKLFFGYSFDQKLNGNLPHYIKELTFGYSFNQPLEKNDIPLVDYLIFGNSFNQSIELKHDHQDNSTLFYQGNSTSSSLLPIILKELTFGDSFNQKLNQWVLPSGITKLKFGDSFDQKLSISRNRLENFINKIISVPVINLLPRYLTELSLGRSFNQPLSLEILPSKIKKIKLYRNHMMTQVDPKLLPICEFI